MNVISSLTVGTPSEYSFGATGTGPASVRYMGTENFWQVPVFSQPGGDPITNGRRKVPSSVPLALSPSRGPPSTPRALQRPFWSVPSGARPERAGERSICPCSFPSRTTSSGPSTGLSSWMSTRNVPWTGPLHVLMLMLSVTLAGSTQYCTFQATAISVDHTDVPTSTVPDSTAVATRWPSRSGASFRFSVTSYSTAFGSGFGRAFSSALCSAATRSGTPSDASSASVRAVTRLHRLFMVDVSSPLARGVPGEHHVTIRR